MQHYLELSHIEDLENCETNCPLTKDTFSEEAAEWMCSECRLNSEEYQEMTDYSPLFELAVDYLARHKLGLQDPPSAHSEQEIQAILLVTGEIERQHREHADKERDDWERKHGGKHLTDHGDGEVEG